jgi:hypothetical protein
VRSATLKPLIRSASVWPFVGEIFAMLGFQRNFRTALGGYVCNTRKLLLRIQEKQLVRIQPSLRMLEVRLQL